MMNKWIDDLATKKILEGIKKYGPLNLATDKRCFIAEIVGELIDAINYLKFGYDKGQILKEDWSHLNKVIRYCIIYLKEICPGEGIR